MDFITISIGIFLIIVGAVFFGYPIGLRAGWRQGQAVILACREKSDSKKSDPDDDILNARYLDTEDYEQRHPRILN